MWNKVKAIQEIIRSKPIILIRPNNSIILNNKETSNLLIEAFVNNSSNSNYNSEFLINKTYYILLSRTILTTINKLFRTKELVNIIKKFKNTSSDPNKILNILIIKLDQKMEMNI